MCAITREALSHATADRSAVEYHSSLLSLALGLLIQHVHGSPRLVIQFIEERTFLQSLENRHFAMGHKNTTSRKDGGISQQLLLPQYTLETLLVLMPGILYNVTLLRPKAAALLARYGSRVAQVPVAKELVAEYKASSPDSMASGELSRDAANGITQFDRADKQMRAGARVDAEKSDEASYLSLLVLAVRPNLSKIDTFAESKPPLDAVTVCKIVGLSEQARNIRLTLQAIVRGSTPGQTLKEPEAVISIDWSEKSTDSSGKLQDLKRAAEVLFVSMNNFVVQYRQAIALKENKTESDLGALNPLSSALFLQLAGSKDFERAYATLQKLVSGSLSDSSKNLSRVLDLTTAIIPFPSSEKLRILLCFQLDERADTVVSAINKLNMVFETLKENSEMANNWFNNEASNLQKATLVANQLKSIRMVLEGIAQGKPDQKQKRLVRSKNQQDKSYDAKSLDDDEDDDDLRVITDFVKNRLPEISSISEDSKRLIVKDFKRIKNSPPGNADFHVIRNYLEIVADLPWDHYVSKFKSNKEIDLQAARHQLDEDHYGLEHVKERLLQYLVVLKLLGANAEQEYAQIRADQAKKRKLEMEKRKFKRESANGESIIIPDEEDKEDEKEERNMDDSSYHSSLLASKKNKSPIIMLTGPPGVGKTSLAKSIATTLGRNFQRVSLGGVRDESEIRGHRRTYVGAMAGTIVQALRKSRSMNPVILLDEIDKIVGGQTSSAKVNGDPAAALLEVLDPEQNTQFMDHYIGFPIDLSQVMFICTANEPYNLSRPLLDRLEMIEIGAYDYGEKLVIGQKYLLPRQISRNGFPELALVKIDDSVMKKVILEHTREAGVRNFERKLGTICRFKAVEYSRSLSGEGKYSENVNEYDLAQYLGLPFSNMNHEMAEVLTMSSKYGVVNGMSYNSDGSGSVLVFESIGIPSEKGASLNMTGRLGEVLMESAKIGMTFLKNTLHKGLLNVSNTEELLEKFNTLEVHMHVPSGAVLKDGPSAGITMALLFLSMLLEKPVPLNIAMTGEITLRGLVLPIGGLKEKLLGAHLTGQIDKIVVPRENRRDVIEHYVHKINEPGQLNELLKDNATVEYENAAPEKYFKEKYNIQVLYAKEFRDVIRHVWGDGLVANVEDARMEYHL